MIPNIVHFIYISHHPHTEDFCYLFFLGILSAKKVNQPEAIYFYYNFEPIGPWWEAIKPLLTLVKVDPPKEIDGIPIYLLPHQSDVLRLEILIELGGIYLDLDTICCRPWKHLLPNQVVLGREPCPEPSICNAILMAEKDAPFMNYWYDHFHKAFDPHGWNQASCQMPGQIARFFDVLVMPPQTFFLPWFNQVDLIFKNDVEINPELITQHLWCTSASSKIIKQINPLWIQNHPQTLYSRIVKHVFEGIPDLGYHLL
jgi:hypothetical protein